MVIIKKVIKAKCTKLSRGHSHPRAGSLDMSIERIKAATGKIMELNGKDIRLFCYQVKL